MTKEIITQWATKTFALTGDEDDFEERMDAAMEEAAKFVKEPICSKGKHGLDPDLYVDLCDLQWLWKHLKHTEYDVGAGADEDYPVLLILDELLDRVLGRSEGGFYEFN